VIPAMEPSEMGEIKGVGIEQSGGRIGILFGRFTFLSVRVFLISRPSNVIVGLFLFNH
jgi:hypothetical protein